MPIFAMFHVEHCTYNSGRVAGRQFIDAASTSELEPPRSTVYKDLGSTMPGAVLPACAMQTAMFPQTVCKRLILKRKWWNWQTHHLEGVAPKGVRSEERRVGKECRSRWSPY